MAPCMARDYAQDLWDRHKIGRGVVEEHCLMADPACMNLECLLLGLLSLLFQNHHKSRLQLDFTLATSIVRHAESRVLRF